MTAGNTEPTAKKAGKKKTSKAKPRKKAPTEKRKPAKSSPAGPAAGELVSVRAAAKLLGVSHTAVQKAIEQGRLKTSISPRANGRGFLVDARLAAQEWEANTDPAQTRRGVGQDRKVPARAMPLFDEISTEDPASDQAKTPSDPGDIGRDDYLDSRARREHFRAKEAEIEFRKKAGELVERRAEEAAGFEIARALRDRLILMAETTAPLVMGLSSLPEVRKIILEAASTACQDLFDRFDPDRSSV